MKRILYFFISLSLFLFSYSFVLWNCTISEWSSIWNNLDSCLENSKLVWWSAEIGGWFDTTIRKWTTNISLFLWVAAVLWIVYWAFTMTISVWEDEKVNKAKGIIKWSIIWFIWIITASFIINLIVRLFYSLS